jgi:hypothetical protein
MYEGDSVTYPIYGMDPDGPVPSIILYEDSTDNFENLYFYDSGNGTAVCTFTPDETQGDATVNGRRYDIMFAVVDAEYPSDTNTSTQYGFRVFDVNFPPVINPVNDTTIIEGDSLQFMVSATDDKTVPVLTAENMPSSNASFTGLPNLKSFKFYPDYTQSGLYSVRFIASDGEFADTMVVNITVIESGNHNPVFDSTVLHTTLVVANRDTTLFLRATDVDADPIVITCDSLVPNAVFTDSGGGVATYYFAPTTDQINLIFPVRFIATDPLGTADTVSTTMRVISILRGDINFDTQLNMLDILYLINYLYKEGDAPVSMEAADANYDTSVNLMDATFLINFFYKGGPPPPPIYE